MLKWVMMGPWEFIILFSLLLCISEHFHNTKFSFVLFLIKSFIPRVKITKLHWSGFSMEYAQCWPQHVILIYSSRPACWVGVTGPDLVCEETETQRNKQLGQGLKAMELGEGEEPHHGGVCYTYCLVPF